MNHCCVCKTPITKLICAGCFSKWPKGMGFREYTAQPYIPEPVIVPTGLKLREDYPK